MKLLVANKIKKIVFPSIKQKFLLNFNRILKVKIEPILLVQEGKYCNNVISVCECVNTIMLKRTYD